MSPPGLVGAVREDPPPGQVCTVGQLTGESCAELATTAWRIVLAPGGLGLPERLYLCPHHSSPPETTP
jgi:hypothetical protein